MNDLLWQLESKNLVWHGSEQQAHSIQTPLKSGHKALDEALGGGFLTAGVIALSAQLGIGELRLFFNLLKEADGLIIFINPPGVITYESLHYEGITEPILILQSLSLAETLWCAEQSLANGAASFVFIWAESVSIAQAKRLQLAAEKGQAIAPLFIKQAQYQFSLPVPLNLHLSAVESGLHVHIKKRRGSCGQHKVLLPFSAHWPELYKPVNINNVAELQLDSKRVLS